MSRGKKKEELTLEEKLEQALVPVEEQPYEVPGNWCWVRVEIVCSCPITDGTHKTPTYCEKADGVPFVSAKDITSEYIDWSNVKYIVPDLHQELYKRLAPQKNDVLLAKNGTTGVAALVEENTIFDLYVTIAVLRPNVRIILPQFLYRLINSPICKNQFDNHLTGIGVPNLHLRDIKNISIPLPPIKEQQRIVERIENLFSKLDEAKEKVQFVQNSSDDNFVSVVHEALVGNLTQEWREQNGISKSTWKRDKLGNLGCLERGRSKHRPRNDSKLFGGSYPFIQTGDVAEADVFIEKHKQTLSEFGLAQSRMFPEGTLCITIAANIGDVAILSYDCCFPDSVVGFTPNEDVESKYIYYVMSELQKEIEANAPATAQKNINLKILNDIDITIPSIIEQREIIAILDGLYNKKKRVKGKAEQIIDAIDIMKKSILAKAFRGELGTNNLEEESSVEQLKQILGGVE